MRVRVSISLLPSRSEQHVIEASSTGEAVREVLALDGVREAMSRRPMAGVVISAFVEEKGMRQEAGGKGVGR